MASRRKLTQAEVDEQPLLMRVPMVAELMGYHRQRIYELIWREQLGFKVFHLDSTRRVSAVEVLTSLGYDTAALTARLFRKPMLNEADLRRLLGLSTPTVRTVIEQAGIPAVQLGAHPRYSATALAEWLGVEPDHDVRTLSPSSAGEPGTSCVVRTRGGKEIRAGKPYSFGGRVWDGSDIIAIARVLGVVA